jgi:hypothetical protein
MMFNNKIQATMSTYEVAKVTTVLDLISAALTGHVI